MKALSWAGSRAQIDAHDVPCGRAAIDTSASQHWDSPVTSVDHLGARDFVIPARVGRDAGQLAFVAEGEQLASGEHQRSAAQAPLRPFHFARRIFHTDQAYESRVVAIAVESVQIAVVEDAIGH